MRQIFSHQSVDALLQNIVTKESKPVDEQILGS